MMIKKNKTKTVTINGIEVNHNTHYVTYVVRDHNSRRFLNSPVYTGRRQGIWGLLENAQTFFTRKQAQSCASSINSRRPKGYSAYFAEVRPFIVKRQNPIM